MCFRIIKFGVAPFTGHINNPVFLKYPLNLANGVGPQQAIDMVIKRP
jgi:hypothetical protein